MHLITVSWHLRREVKTVWDVLTDEAVIIRFHYTYEKRIYVYMNYSEFYCYNGLHWGKTGGNKTLFQHSMSSIKNLFIFLTCDIFYKTIATIVFTYIWLRIKDFGNTTNYILIKHIFIILYTSRREAEIAQSVYRLAPDWTAEGSEFESR
jgi:hypothetical protein